MDHFIYGISFHVITPFLMNLTNHLLKHPVENIHVSTKRKKFFPYVQNPKWKPSFFDRKEMYKGSMVCHRKSTK